MNFCTSVSCIDGRAQLPINNFLQKRFNAEFVDTITEAGVNKVLSDQTKIEMIESIINKVSISISKHNSESIAISGHYDCAGNPVSEAIQISQIKEAVLFIKNKFKDKEIIGLWVDENWSVTEL